MNKGLLIIILGTILSCSTDKQEPIFHLFQCSERYPHYNEVDFLKKEGFSIKVLDNNTVLTKADGKTQVLYILIDNEEDGLTTKVTRVYLSSFDTIQADIEIKNFGGHRATGWKIQDDTTLVTTVSFNDYEIELKLKNRHRKNYLESVFDLWHRVMN